MATQIYLFTYSPKMVTLSPCHKYQDDIDAYFKPWHRCMEKFEVNPEFNQNGNLHYHGYYILKDDVKWYRHILPRLKHKGFIKIDKVKQDFEKAIVYCRKDREKMVKILDGLPVPYTHDNKIIKLKETPKCIIDMLDEL